MKLQNLETDTHGFKSLFDTVAQVKSMDLLSLGFTTYEMGMIIITF